MPCMRLGGAIVCSGNKPVAVEHNGKTYRFEWTEWAGWIPVNKDGGGRLSRVPDGAWALLERRDTAEAAGGGSMVEQPKCECGATGGCSVHDDRWWCSDCLWAEVERLRKWERVQGFPEVVCLCGSTRFMDKFHSVGWQLALDGYIVVSVGVCKHAEYHGGEALGEDVCEKLDELHNRKIDLADWVMVLNVGGYVGDSTRAEIEYARAHDKMVVFLEDEAAEPAGGK